MNKLTLTRCPLLLTILFGIFLSAQIVVAQTTTGNQSETATTLTPQPHIVGGKNADDVWPYMTALIHQPSYQKYGSLFDAQFCGGTLIAKNWVMTAAHCLAEIPASSISLAVGVYSLNENNVELISAKRTIIHPRYNHDAVWDGYDIGLIELSRDSSSTEFASILEDTNVVLPGKTATIIGWGSLQYQDLDQSYEQVFSPVLQQANTIIVDKPTCDAPFSDSDFNDSIFCAGYAAGGVGTCQGDSGGPLFIQINGRYVQAGITSAGAGCAYAGMYELYADVAYLKDFVRQYVPKTTVTSNLMNKNASGTWYNPARDGEGWMIEMLNNNQLVMYWYTYDKANNPLYIYGSGTYDPIADSVTINTQMTKGAKFGNAFDKNQVQRIDWGTVTLSFKDCENATISYNGSLAGYGAGTHDVKRLTATNSSNCFSADDGSDNRATGLWYLPERSGEGFTVESLAGDLTMVYWFTYDLVGKPLYLYGVGNTVNGKTTLTLQQTSGTSFGEALDPSKVVRKDWGTLTFTTTSCSTADVSYQGNQTGYGSGSFKALSKIAYIDGGCQ